MSLPLSALGGVAAVVLALLLGAYTVLAPGRARLPAERRRPGAAPTPGAVSRAAGTATAGIDRLLGRQGGRTVAAALEQAGMRLSTQDFVFFVIVATLVTGAAGLAVSGPLVALVLGALTPVGARVTLRVRASRRQSAFADQLDDSLQLLSSSLRAGHSLLQSLASVAREAEEPTSEEFARIINETRVGRELATALDEAAVRMGSEDFAWVTQAIAINREVGGNLAEVLDRVGGTIRERNQIRRQVKALSAEGKLSAVILMALPFGISAFLAVANPEYIGAFTESAMGYLLIVVSMILLAVGGLWLRKVVSFQF